MTLRARLSAALPDALRADRGPSRVVAPSSFSIRLTMFSAGAMAFLAVLALALALAADGLATHWSDALARTATVRIPAPVSGTDARVARTLEILRTTPGVAAARRLDRAEEEALLAPWLGPDLPLDALPVPALIEVTEDSAGIDTAGLTARLAGEVPGAVFDDHTTWRAPLVEAAARLRLLGLSILVLIAATTAAIVALSARAALAANARVVAALRLVGARDAFIVRAFVRRLTLRATAGALVGTVAALALLLSLPAPAGPPGVAGTLLPGLRPTGWQWALAGGVPMIAASVAFLASRLAAFRQLRETT